MNLLAISPSKPPPRGTSIPTTRQVGFRLEEREMGYSGGMTRPSRILLVSACLAIGGCHASNQLTDGGPLEGSGDCESDDDCPSGSCVALGPGGFLSCTEDLEATECTPSGSDECCDSGDCTSGICALVPGDAQCGGVFIGGFNGCMIDECASDDDCFTDGICLPAGVLGRPVRRCMYALCRVDSDCADESGGVCAPVQTTCCDGPNTLACVYPSDGCHDSDDCDGIETCDLTGPRAHCVSDPVACPL